jgi:formate hydrogenlyase transcriptional activator
MNTENTSVDFCSASWLRRRRIVTANTPFPANDPQFIQKKLRELSTLAEMNEKIHSTMDLDRLLQILVEKAVIGVNFERGLIYLVEGAFLRCVAFLDRVKREQASRVKDWVGFRMDETAIEVLCVQEGRPMYVQNARKDERVSKKFLKITDTEEYCVVPLLGRSTVLGVLTGDKFYSRKPILPEDMDTLQLFAGHISLAIENATLYEEKERFNQALEAKVAERTSELALANKQLSDKMKELSTLFEMSKLLGKSLHTEAVSKHILSMIRHLGHQCAIHLHVQGKAGPVYQDGLDEKYEAVATIPLERDMKKRLSARTDPVSIPGLRSKTWPSSLLQYLGECGIRSGLLSPLRSKEALMAVLAIYASEPDFFREDQKRFFSAFAQQAGLALENALIFQEVLDQKNHMETLTKRLEEENVCLREKIKANLKRNFVVGKSPAMNEVMDLVRKVGPTSATVILYGETGTGKELVANAIHELGPRKNAPIIKVNCAAIPDDLLESELFGHEKGAFTGAHERRIGMFQLGQNGTIFLDEIGDLSLKTQTKLLRVLQEQEVQPLGAKLPVRVDVRVIAATNKDLKKKIQDESFRSDLYYRLNVFPIHLPPLRERRQDIPELVEFFLRKYAYLRPTRAKLDQTAMEVFLKYSWPGNIRELENIIERLMIIARDDVVTAKDLPVELWEKPRARMDVKPLGEAIEEFKKDMVAHVLFLAGGKKSKAAEMLGLPSSNFSRLLKELGMRQKLSK